MRPTSALARSPGRPWRRLGLIAAGLAAMAGCTGSVPGGAAHPRTCPPGQHWTAGPGWPWWECAWNGVAT